MGDRFPDAPFTGERAGVRRDRLGTLRALPADEQHDRFLAARPTQRPEQSIRAAGTFEVQADDRGVGIVDQPVEHLARRDVDGVAHAEHLGEPHASVGAAIDDVAGETTALRHDAHAADGVRRVQLERLSPGRAEHADAVRADHARLHLARGREQVVAQCRAAGTDFVEATADHVHERHPPRCGAHDVGATRCGHRHQQIVDRRVDRGEVVNRAHAVDLGGVGMQRVEIVGPTEGAVRGEGAVAETAPRRRRTRDRDRPRCEQSGEVGRGRRVGRDGRVAQGEAGVERDRPGRRDQHRVALELDQLVTEPHGQPVGAGESHEDLDDGVGGHRGPAAELAERTRARELAHQRTRVGLLEREHAQRHQVEQFRDRATEAERGDESERLSPYDAHDELDAVVGRVLFLDEEARGRDSVAPQSRAHVVDRDAELVVFEPEAHGPELGLVHDAGPVRLQRERRAERARVRNVGARDALRHRHTEVAERRLHVGLGDGGGAGGLAVRHRTVAPRSRPAPCASRRQRGRR